MNSGSAVRWLVRGVLLGLLCAAIAGLLLIVSDVAAYVMLGVGALLLLVMPFAAAVVGAEARFHPDHKVEGRTFLIDLWRSIPPVTTARERGQSERKDRRRS